MTSVIHFDIKDYINLSDLEKVEESSFSLEVHHAKEQFFGFVLVEKGEKGENCGELFPTHMCEVCYKVHFVKHQCGRKSCPDCGRKWVSKATRVIVHRLLEYRAKTRKRLKERLKKVEDPKVKKQLKMLNRLVHVTVSVDPSYYFDYVNPITGGFNIDLLRLDAIQYLTAKTNGYFAGVLVFHPFRPNERYYAERKEEREEEDENPAKELKKWQWIKSKDNWQEYVKFSPHFHFIGYVGWLEPPAEGEKFIYKLIKNKEGNYYGIKDEREVYAVVYYILSHTADKKDVKNFHSYVWVGRLSYRNFKSLRRKKEREVRKCKKCGGLLRGWIQILKSYFYIAHSIRKFLVFDVKYLKLLVLKDDKLTIEQRMNIMEALDIWSGWKPPPELIVEG